MVFPPLVILFAAISPVRAARPGLELKNNESLLVVEPSSGRPLLEYDEKGYLDLQFPTGSLIKVFTVVAALKQDPSFKNFRTTCRPSRWSNSSFETCWYRQGHGEIGLEEALAQSCNWYLREMAERIKPINFWETLADFGLIKRQRLAEYLRWSRRETLEVMVGTGIRLKVSPRALLYAYCALFNGGYLFEASHTGPAGVFLRVKVSPEILRVIRSGMSRCWSEGSGKSGLLSSGQASVAGKTGTAAYYCSEDTGSWKTHGMFVGFSPQEGLPRAGIIVFCFSGDGRRAAEIAGDVLAVIGRLSSRP